MPGSEQAAYFSRLHMSLRTKEGKRKNPSIYRKLEIFISEITKHIDNVPGKPMLQAYVSRLSNELIDCLATTKYAYTTQDVSLRYSLLRDMEVHLDLCSSIIDILFEYASNTTSRFMTPDQHSKYLLNLDDIERQRKSWADSTHNLMSSNGNCG